MAERSTATSPPQRPAETSDAAGVEESRLATRAAASAPTTPREESGEPAEDGTNDTASAATEEAGDRAEATTEEVLPPAPAELHSGHRLAGRYRLEECITRLDGFSSWRAVDEKLKRAVGIHVLPASHERAPAVLAAARAAALLIDPRFVQVLDADEENGQVHVVHEWLAEATPLSTLLQVAPLEAYEAYQLASQVATAVAAAHREGLSHLRLSPACVLRTGPSQYRIRGLAVDAALRGLSAVDPRRADTEAIGALMYAALTQRWPYPEGAHGLRGVVGLGKGDALATPEQVRAGVHRGLSELTMRALINDGATAASHSPPCTTPAALAEALTGLPRIPPSDPTPTHIPAAYRPGPATPGRPRQPVPPAAPALPGRTGTALKWGVSALLIAALGLGSWQLADVLYDGDAAAEPAAPSAAPPTEDEPSSPQVLAIPSASDFDPEGDPAEENAEEVPYAIDGDPGTFWPTQNYYGDYESSFGNLKSGVGLVLDLGEVREVNSLSVTTDGETGVQFRAAPADAAAMPTTLDGYTRLDAGTGDALTLRAAEPVETQFVLVWLTQLPQDDDGNYRGRITEVSVFR